MEERYLAPNICIGICILAIVWVVLSFIDVDAHNVGNKNYAKWNAIILFVNKDSVEVDGKTFAIKKDNPVPTVTPSTICTTKASSTRHKVKHTVRVRQSDIKLLARLLYAENGNAKNDDAVVLTGIVVMKRIKSSQFPNTLRKVIFQTGQYACVSNGSIYCKPSERCTEIAEEILRLNLQKRYPDSLVFQAEFVQGKVYRHIGNQYFCLERK